MIEVFTVKTTGRREYIGALVAEKLAELDRERAEGELLAVVPRLLNRTPSMFEQYEVAEVDILIRWK